MTHQCASATLCFRTRPFQPSALSNMVSQSAQRLARAGNLLCHCLASEEPSMAYICQTPGYVLHTTAATANYNTALLTGLARNLTFPFFLRCCSSLELHYISRECLDHCSRSMSDLITREDICLGVGDTRHKVTGRQERKTPHTTWERYHLLAVSCQVPKSHSVVFGSCRLWRQAQHWHQCCVASQQYSRVGAETTASHHQGDCVCFAKHQRPVMSGKNERRT
jgi:hypothetical protein